MRAVIEIAMAILFTLFIGADGIKLAKAPFKKETLKKISKGLGSLESFSQKLTC